MTLLIVAPNLLQISNFSQSTASGIYRRQRLHPAGPGGSAKKPSSRQVVLMLLSRPSCGWCGCCMLGNVVLCKLCNVSYC